MRIVPLVLLLSATLTGCDVVVDQPLSDPRHAQADSAALGHWVATFRDEEGLESRWDLFVGANHDARGRGMQDAILEVHNICHERHSMRFAPCPGFPQVVGTEFYFSTTGVGKQRLANMFLIDSDKIDASSGTAPDDSYLKAVSGWMVVRYALNGRQLTVEFLEKKSVEQLVKDGILEADEEGVVSATSLLALLQQPGGPDPYGSDDQHRFVFRKAR